MNLPEIKLVCAEAYGVSVKDIDSRKRTGKIASARMAAYYYARKFLGLTLEKAGEEFKRNHGAIHHGVKRVEEYRECDWETQAMLEGIEAAYPCLTNGGGK